MNHREFKANVYKHYFNAKDDINKEKEAKDLKEKYELGKDYYNATSMGGLETRKLVELGEEMLINDKACYNKDNSKTKINK